jgi:hypothetical protein
MTKPKWAIFTCGLVAFLGIGIAVLTRQSGTPNVTLDLLETRRTNGRPVAVFRVNNAGNKSADLSFDSFDNIHRMPLAVALGRCSVPPGSNCTVTITGFSRTGTWHVYAGVFLPLTTVQKGRIAVYRLRAYLSGEAWQGFWPSDGYYAAYRISSPEVPDLSFADVDWMADQLDDVVSPPLAQPVPTTQEVVVRPTSSLRADTPNVDLGVIELSSHTPKRVSFGTDKKCLLFPIVQPDGKLRIELAIERWKDGMINQLAHARFSADSGQMYAFSVGDTMIALTPTLKKQ